mmetsp:Transcript_49140/g.126730  ORF Transcript_49140/g.126730 Transcript_49140/m.126730 type:complete len:211 (+) Transcript_49140:1975-2607(+)
MGLEVLISVLRLHFLGLLRRGLCVVLVALLVGGRHLLRSSLLSGLIGLLDERHLVHRLIAHATHHGKGVVNVGGLLFLLDDLRVLGLGLRRRGLNLRRWLRRRRRQQIELLPPGAHRLGLRRRRRGAQRGPVDDDRRGLLGGFLGLCGSLLLSRLGGCLRGRSRSLGSPLGGRCRRLGGCGRGGRRLGLGGRSSRLGRRGLSGGDGARLG